MVKITNTFYLNNEYIKLNLKELNVPVRLKNEFTMINEYAKTIKAEVYFMPLDPGLFYLKKNKNKTLYGGYKGEIKPRVKFTKTPERNIETLLKRFKLKVSSFDIYPAQSVTGSLTYFKETEVAKTVFFNLANQISRIFKSCYVEIEEFVCGSTQLTITTQHHIYRLVLKYIPYTSKKEIQ